MRTVLVLSLLLGSSLAASAQETLAPKGTLLDGPLPASLADEEEGEQEKQEKREEQIVVSAGKLDDENPVGPYKRPMWTLHRVSPQTRIYLQVDPGEVEFEQWVDMRVSKDTSKGTEARLSEEFEFGLGSRFQLDLYANSVFEGSGRTSTLVIRSWAAELRYAFADWGVIPGNPTLYLEYILWNNNPNDGTPGDQATASIEPKLLLGGEFAAGWHWGANLFFERTFNESVREHGVTFSLLHTVVDKVFTAGLASEYKYESDELPGGSRNRTHQLYVGPSFQLRMAPVESEVEVNGVKTKITRARAHLDVEPIWGCTGESDRAQIVIIFGWDF
ncbi:MAG TPA: hypothetical protein VKW04_22600 [Planctomycetota bacterium]|nr:hypothetical protein [Planctomycetota bacterium]